MTKEQDKQIMESIFGKADEDGHYYAPGYRANDIYHCRCGWKGKWTEFIETPMIENADGDLEGEHRCPECGNNGFMREPTK